MKKRKKMKGDFGSCSVYCKHCEKEFSIEWRTIFDIQEITHGNVGFHTNDVYISCPTCDRVVENEDITPESDRIVQIKDGELPF
ncbi:hypothetical protein [Metabacillus arenae]|uniref:Uncharacterized protein n=1 Tax=Metabacillus arenae TaxID=2771434 RepID=A0A926NFC8_9BACI|nr:hypothetical protein [Metabacillus arenae]MBD1379785.1 hypothetical protein [Metabacillus arenae]